MGFLDKAKAAAEQAAAKAKEGVEDVQQKRELSQAYNELGKTAFDLIESGELSHSALASKVAEIAAPVDFVTLAIDDQDLLKADATRSRHFGFGGKLCIHPNQIAATNDAFRPTDHEVEWARGILAEQERRRGDAVFAHRGALVDRPVLERAKRIVADAG